MPKIVKNVNFDLKTFKRSIQNVKKDTYLSLSNMFIMIITFLILGVFITLIAMSQTKLRELEGQAQITVFFKDDFSEANIIALKDKYVGDSRIESIKYVSKEEAFKIFSDWNKDEPTLLQSISADILPASLEVRAKNSKDLSALSNEFKSVSGVEDIRYFKEMIDQFRFWSNLLYAGGFILLVVFVFISYSIILYTLKSTIDAKRMELSVLKLVGASDYYVTGPFVYQGLLFGVVSASVAGLFILLISIVATLLGGFKEGIMLGFFYDMKLHIIVFSLMVFLILVLFGGALGYFGSSSALKKYLKY